MPLTKDELLRPKYKVIDKYPGMELEPFHVGQIITLQPHKEGYEDVFIHIPIKHIPGSYMRQSFFDLYPNLFKRMLWYEGLEYTDLPLFLNVNYKTGIQFHKVNQWLHKIGEQFVYEYQNEKGLLLRETTGGTIPADEFEYQSYITQKQ